MRVVDLMNQLSCFKGKKMVVLTESGLRVSGKEISVPLAPPSNVKAADKAPEKAADKAPEKAADKKTDGG